MPFLLLFVCFFIIYKNVFCSATALLTCCHIFSLKGQRPFARKWPTLVIARPYSITALTLHLWPSTKPVPCWRTSTAASIALSSDAQTEMVPEAPEASPSYMLFQHDLTNFFPYYQKT